MDIVGVTASAATLIEVTGAIATTITTVVTAVRTADARLTNLSTELSQLTNYLQSVHRTLTQCREADLSLIEDELWRHSEICLTGCRATLDELARVVTGVKTKAQKIFKLGSLGWKSRAAIELGLRGPELECFRERLYKSNSALQTMLHTINVSLSIRSNASQNRIILELSQLKRSIDTALDASTRLPPLEKGTRSHANAARNLREFASLAQSFHSSASSTAGTVRGDNGSIVVVRNESVTSSNEPWHTGPDIPSSIQGDFPPERRERVEMYIRQGRGRRPQREPSVVSLSRSPSLRRLSPSLPSPSLPLAPIEMAVEEEDDALNEADDALFEEQVSRQDQPVVESEDKDLDEDDDDDDEDDFERAFTEALRQLALDSIKMENYEKAIQFLLEALKRSETEANDKPEAINKLQIQLAICYILQGTWLLADPIITSLGATKCGFDTSPLLHAVTLGHLATYSFDSALTSCRLALKIQRRRCKVGQAAWDEYPETMGLLATIYDMMGEGIRAEVVRSQLPRWYAYKHPSTEVEFMKSQKRFLESVLGYHVPSFLAMRYHELDDGPRNTLPDPADDEGRLSPIREGVWDAACDVTQLRTNWTKHERQENDTGKEVVEGPYVSATENSGVKDDADDECSPVTPTEPQPPPLKRRVTRFFRDRRNRRPRDAAATPTDQVSPITPLTPHRPALWRRALKLRLPKNAPRVSAVTLVSPSEELGQGNFGACYDGLMPAHGYEPATLSVGVTQSNTAWYHEMGDSSIDRLERLTSAESASDVPTETSQTQTQTESPSQNLTGSEPSTSPTVYRLPKRRGLDSIRVDTETARTIASQAKPPSTPRPLLSDQLGEAIRELASIYCELPTITGIDEKIVDVESALCKVRELQELKGRFMALSTDSTMVMDIEAAVRRLETMIKPFDLRDCDTGSREVCNVSADCSTQASLTEDKQHPDKVSDQGGSDSGYESAEPQRQTNHDRPSVQADENGVSFDSESDNEQQSRLMPHPLVSKQPSFRVGDDSTWMARARELASQEKGKEKGKEKENNETESPRGPQLPTGQRFGVKTYEGVWIEQSNVMKRMNGLYGRAH